MSTHAATTKPPQVRLTLPTKGLAKWSTIHKALKQMAAQIGFRLEIDGAESAEQTSDGIRFKLRPGGPGSTHPWQGVFEDGDLICRGGMVNGFTLGDFLVTISNGVVYLELDFILDVEDDYVYGSSLSSATIAQGSYMPDDNGSSGTFYLALLVISDGQVSTQSASKNIRVRACNSGQGDGSADLVVLQS